MAPIDPTAEDASCSPVIKRATMVYGKQANRLVAVAPEDEQLSESGRVHHALAAPSRRRPYSPGPSVDAPRSERSCSPGVAGSFQFGFRRDLEKLDEEFDNRNVQSCKPGPSPRREAVQARPSQFTNLQSVSMGTVLSPARRSSGNHSSASLPPSPTSCHITSSQEHPLVSVPTSRHTRRVSDIGLSDSEVEAPSKSSSVSPIRHAITTPHSRSSPTPPTSGENLMAGKRGKGKGPARDVLPLVFNEERSSTAELSIKTKRGRPREPSVRLKTKAPTKKECREAEVESSRIAANRPVEVTRTQEHKHSMAAFLATIRRDSIAAPTSGAELPSDPIEKFSSPNDRSIRALPLNSISGPPTRLLRASTHAGSSNRQLSERTKILPPAAGDSDDEMPSVTSMIQANGMRQKLQTMKRVALQHADTNETFDINSDDDDLLIVEDDMHVVADEEAAQRKLDKAHGSPVKDLATLRRIKHPSVRPVAVSPHKLSRQELQEYAKPSFARKVKGSRGQQLTKKQLDQSMITRHNEAQLESIKLQEEAWIKGGGKLLRESGEAGENSLSQQLGVYAALGLKAAEVGGVVEDDESDDESDEDYTPDLPGSASPEPMDEDEGRQGREDTMEIPRAPPSQEEEEEEVPVPLRRYKSGQRHPRVVVGSDDEEGRPNHRGLPSLQRDSMESQTEDENDKENSAGLMYDRSEDKENKAVVRHEPSSSDITFGSRLGSLHSVEGSSRRRSVSPASTNDLNGPTSSPKGDVRAPLKDISKDEDDLFSSSPPFNSPFTEGLLNNAALSPPRLSTSTISLGSPPVLRSERIRQISRFSLDSENDENDPSGFKPPQPSFLERLHSQVSPEPSLVPINPLPNGGLSQLFSAEDRSWTKPVDKAANDDLSLTLDVGLKPALEVSETLRQKAETIFEKEQEYIIASAVQKDRPKEQLYVNDHGFLTQTRPEGPNSQAYHMTPSQASKFIGTQVQPMQTQPSSVRAPLRTLSFTVSQEVSPELPLRRLRKRSPSPLERRSRGLSSNPNTKPNAFNILGKVPKSPSKAQKQKIGTSEFLAVEAEESDEDDMFGFGGPKKDDQEEEEDNDQDKVAEGLVDDAAMDAETEAADLVIEKHREHVEEDDQRLQKLHQDAVEGKFRIKRRGLEVGFEDDSDEDDDEARRIRQRIHKKRKIEGDSLEALGQSEETRAFYNTYHQDLIDEDDEFGHLREDVAMHVDDDDVQAAEPEKQETVSVDEIRQRVREAAQNNLEVAVLDPEDTSWIDRSMLDDTDDAVRVKVVNHQRSKHTTRHPNAGQMDFDTDRPKRYGEDERERNQLTSWAKNQNHRYQGTGRSGNGTAVTGHAKVKSGGGSLRSAQSSNAASVVEAHKTKKSSSLLSMVSNRAGKFK